MKERSPIKMKIQQVNCFYNYIVGLNATDVDLIKTAGSFLKSGLSKAVCFSDLKSLYLDKKGDIQIEWIQPEGRQWDSNWSIKFSEELPSHVAHDLIFCLELSFHEQRIEGSEAKQIPDYLRTALPPIVLENDDSILPVYPWLKIYSDGIIMLSFQLDTTWKNIDESFFIENVVNIFQRYFHRIWIQEKIQRLDAEQILPEAFTSEFSFGGQKIQGWKSTQLLKKMRTESRMELDKSLKGNGQFFEIDDESWMLHQIAGSEEKDDWEATIDLCRSIYVNAVTSLVVPSEKKNHPHLRQVQMWQGRPSISLIRFQNQPNTKVDLFENFSSSISRILMRSAGLSNPPALPPDLRPFGDYSFHGSRAILLWTWLRPDNSSDDAWEEASTRGGIFENQARAEHFEYHNLRIARACAIAASPPTDESLITAYEVLASAESVLHNSSQAGEITDAISYLLDTVGTSRLITAGKEQARWHLDERRYKNDKNRSHIDRWLAVLFGFVGSAGLADLVLQPFLKNIYPHLSEATIGLSAFLFASSIVGIVAFAIWGANKLR